MANTTESTSHNILCNALLLPNDDEFTVADAVDFKGSPAVRSTTGQWRSAAFINGVEMAERIAFYGIQANLINFLTEKLGQSTASAAANVNAWSGVATLLPVLGAIIADSFLGKYITVVTASLLYILGLGLLMLSAVLPSDDCLTHDTRIKNTSRCSSHLHIVIFFGALYLVALGQGGHKPCVQAFGADQFDGDDPTESKAKSSIFNWWNFGLSLGALIGVALLSYVQENFSWALGYGITCIIMFIALLMFVLGTFTYRFIRKSDRQSPFLRIVFAQILLRLIPIWLTSLIFGIVFAQISTFFTKQGVTLDRSIGPNFKIPAAALQSFISVFVIIILPTYDFLLVPIARNITGKHSGISVLQRIGTGLFISIASMVVAAVVEKKRIKIALQHGLIDLPKSTVPMSIWWLLPQYALFGVADAFTIVGLQEFFYGQVPIELCSVGVSLFFSVLGIGSFLSGFLVSVVDKLTSSGSQSSWLSDNLNRGHLDYFYWLLAALSTLGLILFIWFSRSYVYANNKVRM